MNNIVSGHVTNRRDHVPFRTTARKITKRVLIIAALVFAAMLALGFTLQATGHADQPNKPLPACEFEDSTGCYWDADTMGNGHGQDVVNTR